MASTSETGHAKNVSNFQFMIAFVTAFGVTYNPSKNSLKLPQLITLHDAAEASLEEVINKNTLFNTEVNLRMDAFSEIKYLSTRLLAAIESTDASAETIKDAKGFNRKIHGKRALALPTTPLDPNAPIPKTISASQQSYTQLIQHLAGMVAVLESEISYTPNETDLQIASLQTRIAALTEHNNKVATAYAAISTVRIARNAVLYGEVGSIFDTQAEVKKYVKSVYGASSPQYAQVKGIEFRKIKP